MSQKPKTKIRSKDCLRFGRVRRTSSACKPWHETPSCAIFSAPNAPQSNSDTRTAPYAQSEPHPPEHHNVPLLDKDAIRHSSSKSFRHLGQYAPFLPNAYVPDIAYWAHRPKYKCASSLRFEAVSRVFSRPSFDFGPYCRVLALKTTAPSFHPPLAVRGKEGAPSSGEKIVTWSAKSPVRRAAVEASARAFHDPSAPHPA
jgi:hypothetical protein